MTAESLHEVASRASARFQERYGRRPQWVVAAPGRVNIIGEHIDYNDGFVLPMAIERYTVIAAAKGGMTGDESRTPHQDRVRPSLGARVFSTTTRDEVAISVASPTRHSTPGHWSNYVAGVIAGFACRRNAIPTFDAVIESTVPVGGGLSSSAALEVATATLLEAITGTTLGPVEKALLCQEAEHEYAGVPCGIMDQFASVLCRENHLMLLDCRSREVEHIPLSDPGITVLIINTNVKHELSGGEYAERRGQCESAARKLGVASLRDGRLPQLRVRQGVLAEAEFRRARHAIGEIARTVAAAAAVKAGTWPEVGRLMYESHASLRDDYEVSCPELDLLVELARGIGPEGGVIGSRMTGGGFGGCTVSLVETAKVAAVVEQICGGYEKQTGIEPTALTSRPARGAHVVHVDSSA